MMAVPRLLRRYGQMSVTHQTGNMHLQAVRQAYGLIEGRERIDIQPFIHAFAEEVARAQLVISRAGAITVAELTAAGKPAILIPLPTAADDHQRRNAESLDRAGAARCLLQSELTPDRLVAEVTELIENPPLLAAMADASRRQAHPRAAQEIVDLVYQVLDGAAAGQALDESREWENATRRSSPGNEEEPPPRSETGPCSSAAVPGA